MICKLKQVLKKDQESVGFWNRGDDKSLIKNLLNF